MLYSNLYTILSHNFGCKSVNITHINGIRTCFRLCRKMSTGNPIRLQGLPMLSLNYLYNSATSGLVQSEIIFNIAEKAKVILVHGEIYKLKNHNNR